MSIIIAILLSPMYIYAQGYVEYNIRDGKALTKWLEKRIVVFPPDMLSYGYTTEVTAMARLKPNGKRLEFIGVAEDTHGSFIHELSRAQMPYVNPKRLKTDTLFFQFDFSKMLNDASNFQKIETYISPTIDGERIPYKWMSEVLGNEICELLYFRNVKCIGAVVEVYSTGDAKIDILSVDVDIPLQNISRPDKRWNPTIINGEAVTMKHSFVFDVAKLLTAEQRAKIDQRAIGIDTSGKIYTQNSIRWVDHEPKFNNSTNWGRELNVWMQSEMEHLKEDNKIDFSNIKVQNIRKINVIKDDSYDSYINRNYVYKNSYNDYFYMNRLYPNLKSYDATLFDNYVDNEVKKSSTMLPLPTLRASVIIGANGAIDKVEIVSSPDTKLSDVITHILKKSTTMWTPAIHEGKYVKCRLVVDVDFRD